MKLNRILGQLQQRRVTRVAALYAAAAWALLQVADVMFPIMGLSENAITMVLLLAVVGFPLSLVLSWVFNITSRGITATSQEDIRADIERFRLTPLRAVAITVSLTLIVLVGYFYLERLSENRLSLFDDDWGTVVVTPTGPARETAVTGNGRATIAVLPFQNFSDVADMEHFGDGLAEEILNLLAKLDELSVAARTSSFYFKDRDFDIPTIAQHLGVRYVLEGSVRHSGSQVRVTAQLIDATNGFHLWSETYDREPDNIFTVQDDISREVVENLQLILSPESRDILEDGASVDPVAYEFYLRGRDYLRKPRDPQSLKNAEEMFSKAVSLSPDYSDAFAGLCDTQLQQYSANHEKVRFSAAEKACQRAQILDNSSPAVYIALGNLYRASGQFALAERKFNRALTLKPSAVDAHIGLAETFKAEGKYALAEETLASALELEPNNWAASMAMGRYLFDVGRVEESIRYFERINDLMPESNAAANNLGSAYFLMGRFEDAAQAWEKALSVTPMATVYANLGSSYFFLGRYDEAAAIYPKALEMAPESFENWGNLADAYRHSTTLSELAPKAYERAIALAKEHLQINPSDAFAIAALGHYLACTGQREEALENIELARQLAENDMMVYYFSATALCALGEQQLALEAVRVALSLGYPPHMVEADAGLSSLKEMPDYTAVLAGEFRQYLHLTDKEKEQ
ncbi:MAG: tetratricopeptide repeat protein [Halioglobus sp.]|nr:tetratricopeptide repeat protein [Halioglobus sp.]